MGVQVRTTHVVQLLILLLGILKLVASATWYTASDGHKYLIEKAYNYNWLQAHDECSRQNLQLVVIDSATKNKNLDSVLRGALGTSHNLWLGHHDEFNTKKNTKRAFYSSATGQKVSFSNWSSNNPDNDKSVENCAHIWATTDFQWNDNKCATSFGFICEEHHLTTKYRRDIEGKRLTTKQKNTQMSSKFSTTQTEIKQINKDIEHENVRILSEYKKSTDAIIADLKKTIREALAKKPYMQAVVADLGNTISEIVWEKEDDFAKLSHETQQLIEANHMSGERKTTDATAKFAQELTNNTNDIDKLLVF